MKTNPKARNIPTSIRSIGLFLILLMLGNSGYQVGHVMHGAAVPDISLLISIFGFAGSVGIFTYSKRRY